MSFNNRSIFVHFRAAHFLVGHLAAPVENHGLYFVTLAEKPDDLVFANLIIMLGGCRPEFYFLELRAFLMFALLVRFLTCLVQKFPVVGDLADRRVRVRRDLHKVQAPLTGHPHRLKRLH